MAEVRQIGNTLLDLSEIAAVVPDKEEFIVILKRGAKVILEKDEGRELWAEVVS